MLLNIVLSFLFSDHLRGFRVEFDGISAVLLCLSPLVEFEVNISSVSRVHVLPGIQGHRLQIYLASVGVSVRSSYRGIMYDCSFIISLLKFSVGLAHRLLGSGLVNLPST